MPPSLPMHPRPTRSVLVGLAVGVGVLVCLALLWALATVYQARTAHYRHQAERELQTIGRLQANAVSEWRQRRLAEAQALTDDGLLAQAMARWRKSPAEEARAKVQDRLRILQERAHYTAVYFVDPDGRLLLPQDAPTMPLPAAEQQALAHALQSATPGVVEPRRDPFFAFPFFSVMAPLYDGVQPLGVVWLVMDVRTNLYGLLTPWPTASQSAESFLVRAQDGGAVQLSPSDEAPHPMEQTAPASSLLVQAVRGARGMLHTRDADGTPVLAVINAIADSPWFLVSKVDVAEAYGDAATRELLVLGLPVTFALMVAGLLAMAWQRRAWLRERTLKESLARNMQWIESAQKSALVGYYVCDCASGTVMLSTTAADLFHLPGDVPVAREQMFLQMHPQDRAGVQAGFESALAHGTALRLQYRLGPEGHERWVDMWGAFDSQDAHARLTGTVQDITERQLAEAKLDQYRTALEALVRQDPLTGVANRRALTEAVVQEWQRAARTGTPVSLLMLDVDWFKAFNDRYGHLAGDDCLRKVAGALSHTAMRASDLVARYGGEEFVVLLPDASADDALTLAEQLRLAVRNLAIVHAASGVSAMVTVSVGVATLVPTPLPTEGDAPHRASAKARAERESQQLFRHADTALYAAKNRGRDTVAVFEASLLSPAPAPQQTTQTSM